MPQLIYALDSAIDSFFAEAGSASSREECDQFASQQFGGTIQPVSIQGLSSYTVIAGSDSDKIIQFREQAALLDMKMLAIAKHVHKDLVPDCSAVGWIGKNNSQPLAIYEMNRLPGENYITIRASLTSDQQRNTIYSLANFFAQSWQRCSSLSVAEVAAIRSECRTRLEYLVNALPERFHSILIQAQASSTAFFTGAYPMVLTHSDLNEMNILVDPSGNLSGVIDWPDASFQPFGFALYALENALGCMSCDGWKWFDDVEALRNAFWRAFQEQTNVSEAQIELIKCAARVGILIRYGTAYDSGFSGMIGVRDPTSEDFRYLDALLFKDL